MGSGDNEMVDRTLAGMGLKLEDVAGIRRVGDLDHPRILSDLRNAGVSSRQIVWFVFQSLASYDRVLLARDDRTGKYEGALLVQCFTMNETHFLSIEALTGGPPPRAEALARRLLAYLLLSFDSFQNRPVAVLAKTRNPLLTRMMREIAARIDGAGFYPEPAGQAVTWASASLAHRMARQVGPDRRFRETRLALATGAEDVYGDGPMLAAIDLTAVDELTLTDATRRIFRRRPSRRALKPAPDTTIVPMPPAHIAALALRRGSAGPGFVGPGTML